MSRFPLPGPRHSAAIQTVNNVISSISASTPATLGVLAEFVALVRGDSGAGNLNLSIQAAFPMPNFTDIAPSLGVNTVGTDYGPNPADYNQDGRLDLMFTNHFDPLSLFQQSSSGQFTDVVPGVGIPRSGVDQHGAAWGDCDNDGRLDLFISVGTHQPDEFYYQGSNNTFTNITTQADIAADGASGRSASWMDYNNDGHLDCLSLTLKRPMMWCIVIMATVPSPMSPLQTGDLASRTHRYGVAWADYDRDGDMDVYAMSGGSIGVTIDAFSHLYRNNGNGAFTNVTTASGIACSRPRGQPGAIMIMTAPRTCL
jgi:hypothetical protein